MKTELSIRLARAGFNRRGALELGLLWLIVTAGGIGCKPPSRSTGEPPFSGHYTLVSVDEKPVPCTIKHEAQNLTVKSGTFTFNSDGTCRSTIVFSLPSGNDIAREVKATYTRHSSELNMRWEQAGRTSGRLEGDTFTMKNEGMLYTYHK